MIGAIVPNCLSGGSGTPKVQSKSRFPILNLDWAQFYREATDFADRFFKQCWFNRPEDSYLSSIYAQRRRIIGDGPKLDITKLTSCPITGNSCATGVGSVRVEHTGLSLQDFGLNIDAKMTFNHRLTCAPLNMEKFLYPSKDSTGSILSFDERETYMGSTAWSTNLSSLNGPNKYSSGYSGMSRSDYGEGKPTEPSQLFTLSGSDWVGGISGEKRIHPHLSRSDGDVFVSVYKAGRVYYISKEPVDDPLYSSHRTLSNLPTEEFWIPDSEATALGCVEQSQICLGKDTLDCKDWTKHFDLKSSIAFYNFGIYKSISLEERSFYVLSLQKQPNVMMLPCHLRDQNWDSIASDKRLEPFRYRKPIPIEYRNKN